MASYDRRSRKQITQADCNGFFFNGNSLILPEDGVMLRNVVNNKVVFLSLCGRC